MTPPVHAVLREKAEAALRFELRTIMFDHEAELVSAVRGSSTKRHARMACAKDRAINLICSKVEALSHRTESQTK